MNLEDHGLRAVVQGHLDGGHGADDALGVRDGARLVLRHVEVHAHQHALALDIDVLDTGI